MASVRKSSSCFISVPVPFHLHFGQQTLLAVSMEGEKIWCMVSKVLIIAKGSIKDHLVLDLEKYLMVGIFSFNSD
jgi:hypothetical protein